MDVTAFSSAAGTKASQKPGPRNGAGMATQSRVDDTDLIRQAQRGDRAAFETLVRQYDQAVLKLAYHLTRSEQDAQDIYQEAFLKAYRHVGNFRFECSFYTWIYRIVTNLCLDHIRRKQTRLSSRGRNHVDAASVALGVERDGAAVGSERRFAVVARI